jgi:AdoMet-dependent rRNA methyltransferase SPB1
VIDPKFLDPKYAFAMFETEQDSANKISSLKKLFERKRHRDGYAEEKNSGAFYKEVSLEDFVRSEDPYSLLSTVHRFSLDDKVKNGAFKIISPPNDIEEICKDVQILGKREMTVLLKYR